LTSCIEHEPDAYWCYYDRGIALYTVVGDIDPALEDFRIYLELVEEDDCPDCQEEVRGFLEENS
jgi:hypothetical protein